MTEADELGRTALENGRLIVEVRDANALQYAMLREPSFTDFDLTVDATLIMGGAQASYGVLFRMAGPEAFSDLRRVGWLDLEPAENSTLPAGAFPARLYYPPEEGLYNPVNYEAAGGDMPMERPMWWMGG